MSYFYLFLNLIALLIFTMYFTQCRCVRNFIVNEKKRKILSHLSYISLLFMVFFISMIVFNYKE